MNTYKILSKKHLVRILCTTLLAVASSFLPALAQYMVIDRTCASHSEITGPVYGQTIYVQDYENFSGLNDRGRNDELTSTAIINGLFDSFTAAFGAVVGIPAIIIAVLRLFVRRQNMQPRRQARRRLELPAAPAASSFYHPNPAGNYQGV